MEKKVEDQKEIWKAVIGYEGIYSASSSGKVRRDSSNRIVTPQLSNCGYARIYLYKNGVKERFAVSNIIITSFFGKRPAGLQVNHKNGIKNDNRIINLEYVTPSQNTLHAYRILKRPTIKGSKHYRTKLKEEDIVEIRDLYKAGEYTLVQLSDKFNIGFNAISKIINYQRWTHVK
jgi:HNH endonuclease/NUMOD4 motif